MSDLISRQQAIDKFIDDLEEIFSDIRERHVDDSVCGLCEYDGAYIGQSGDWCNECPGFEKDDCFKLSGKIRKEWTDEIIKALPSAQPEPHYDEWCNDCKEYDKERHCCPRWNKVIRETLKDAQTEQRWIPCGKCIHADGKHRWCKILDRSINEDYFCCWAEPYREEGD